MRRILSFCIATIIAVCFSVFSVHAHDYGTVNSRIGVEIRLGGTASIEPDAHSPVPDKTELTLKDGETGSFVITFSSVGIYDYTVRNVPDERDLNYDKTVYRVRISVNDADGALEPTVIVSKGEYKYSDDPERLLFVNTVPDRPEPPPAPSTGDSPGTPAAVFFAMLVCAGALTVSVCLIGRHKRNI